MRSSAPPRRGAVTRQKLLAAALDLFAERGYHATTTMLLAGRTGIAEGTVYRHFASKEALYSAVCRGVWERMEALMAEATSGKPPARDRLGRAARALVAEAQRWPGAFRLQSRPLELAVLDGAARAARDRFRETVTQVIAAGKQEGGVRQGTADLWASLWLAVIWSVCERVAAGEWTPEQGNVALAIDAAWDLVGRPPAARS